MLDSGTIKQLTTYLWFKLFCVPSEYRRRYFCARRDFVVPASKIMEGRSQCSEHAVKISIEFFDAQNTYERHMHIIVLLASSLSSLNGEI